MLIRTLVACLLTTSLAFAEDTYESISAKTDMANPEQVFTLAQWCGEHGKPTEARHLYGKVIKLDPNHEGARAAMGQVRVGERWVAQAHLDAANKPNAAAPAGDAPKGASNAPTVAQVAWDLHLPHDPAPDNTFINGYIDKLPGVKNDSKEMDDAVATLLNDDNQAAAIPRMCAALARPGYGDLFGAAEMIMQLAKAGHIDLARPLEGFLAKASEHVTDAEDLEHFAFAMGLFKDKRALPRLIELYDVKSDSLHDTLEQAVCAITALPPPVSKSRAQEWWNKNYNADPKTLYVEQLKGGDPASQIAAAEALFDLREKIIFPTLTKLMKIDDRPINGRALSLVFKMSGLDFGYAPSLPPGEKEKRVALAEKWWKDNGEKFHFPEAPSAPQAAPPTPEATLADQCGTWVSDLGSIAGNTADQAEASLQGAGLKAVPALIAGLDSTAKIVRRRCNELLKAITKQDFKYDSTADDAARAKATQDWKQWAAAKGLDGESEPAK